jgi:uncharacterized membrane protein
LTPVLWSASINAEMKSIKTKALAGFGLAALAAFLFLSARSDCRVLTGVDQLRINVASLTRGHAQLFCYKDDAGKRLRFVLARGMDGNVRSVFDACRQCFTFHRGYQVAGNELICRVCGNHYSIDHMAEGKASCVPAVLRHYKEADSVTIKTDDLKSGRTLF